MMFIAWLRSLTLGIRWIAWSAIVVLVLGLIGVMVEHWNGDGRA